jgi:hypothetical protein
LLKRCLTFETAVWIQENRKKAQLLFPDLCLVVTWAGNSKSKARGETHEAHILYACRGRPDRFGFGLCSTEPTIDAAQSAGAHRE